MEMYSCRQRSQQNDIPKENKCICSLWLSLTRTNKWGALWKPGAHSQTYCFQLEGNKIQIISEDPACLHADFG